MGRARTSGHATVAPSAHGGSIRKPARPRSAGFVLSLAAGRRFGLCGWPEPLTSEPSRHVRALLVEQQHAVRKSRVLEEARRGWGTA